MRVRTPLGTLRDSAPASYQVAGGRRVPVASRYALRGGGRGFAFAVGAYDPRHELVIDPGIQYTTFLGGSSDEFGAGIAVDGSGNAYVAGTTQSPDFPTTAGAFRRTERRATTRTSSSPSSTRPARRSSTRPSSAGASPTSGAGSRSTPRATPTSRGGPPRPTSRRPEGRSTARSTSRPTATAA